MRLLLDYEWDEADYEWDIRTIKGAVENRIETREEKNTQAHVVLYMHVSRYC